MRAGLLPPNERRARFRSSISLRSQKRVPTRLLTIDLLKVDLVPTPSRRYHPDYHPGYESPVQVQKLPTEIVLILSRGRVTET